MTGPELATKLREFAAAAEHATHPLEVESIIYKVVATIEQERMLRTVKEMIRRDTRSGALRIHRGALGGF